MNSNEIRPTPMRRKHVTTQIMHAADACRARSVVSAYLQAALVS